MILSTSKDGIKRRLIFNDNFICVDREDNLSIYVKDTQLNFEFTINFTFSDDGKELTTSGNVTDNGKQIHMTLFQWNNSFGSELTKPLEFKVGNNKSVWIKFKTAADKKNSFRNFHLTVWGEE